jgi:hypothetical protein
MKRGVLPVVLPYFLALSALPMKGQLPALVEIGKEVLSGIVAPLAVDAVKNHLKQKENNIKAEDQKLSALSDALGDANNAQLKYVAEVNKYLVALKSNKLGSYSEAQYAANKLMLALSKVGSALHDLDPEVQLFGQSTQQLFYEYRDTRSSQISFIPMLASKTPKEREAFAVKLKANSDKFSAAVIQTVDFIDKVKSSQHKAA